MTRTSAAVTCTEERVTLGYVQDFTEFDDVVAEALAAFRNDSAYAVAMARQGSEIIAKRKVWTLRKELRSAEDVARGLCVVSEIAVCGVASPCGTGDCPFARGDLRELRPTPTKSGKSVARPVPSAVEQYNIETVIKQLVTLRTQRGEGYAVVQS